MCGVNGGEADVNCTALAQQIGYVPIEPMPEPNLISPQKMNLDDLWDLAYNKVYINKECAIAYDKYCETVWNNAGEDFDYLLSCIEGNIDDRDYGTEYGVEHIDWTEVKKDYETSRM